MDLERPIEKQGTIFGDNPSDSQEMVLKKCDDSKEEPKTEETPVNGRSYSFVINNHSESDDEEDKFTEDGEDDLFSELDTDMEMTEFTDDDDFFSNNGMMDINDTRKRLEEQAAQRIERLKATGRVEMRPDEFKERLDVPAYLRKEVRFQNVPSSSESQVSKYNLNDDNNILGNNRFLHDNVD